MAKATYKVHDGESYLQNKMTTDEIIELCNKMHLEIVESGNFYTGYYFHYIIRGLIDENI